MPELPEMQALAERLDAFLTGALLAEVVPLGFAALKTVEPPPGALVGQCVRSVGRRGKYLIVEAGAEVGDLRLVLHLGQAGRVDLETPARRTRPRGAVLRLVAEPPGRSAPPIAVLVREHGRERRVAWWVLAGGDPGPLAVLGPDAATPQAEAVLLGSDDRRRLHTLLRDQRTIAGLGRGWADDVLHRARCSPFATLAGLDSTARRRLADAVTSVLAEATEGERRRTGGLSEARLGGRFRIHGRAGHPCPDCATVLARVSYESYEITYCPACQTGGRVLADRRRSRFLR